MSSWQPRSQHFPRMRHAVTRAAAGCALRAAGPLSSVRQLPNGKEAIRADDEVVAKAQILALEKQVRELQRVLGKRTLENEILREAWAARGMI